MRDAAGALRRDYPGIDVHAVVGDFHEHVRFLPRDALDGGPLLVAFLGSTIGNFDEDGAGAVLPPRCASCFAPATGSCWAPTWSRRSAGSTPPTTTPRA